MSRWIVSALGAVVLGLGSATVAGAQNTGTVSGRVVNAVTMAPLPSAQVHVEGTTLGLLTNAEGRFAISNVPAGTHQVRVQVLGFAAAEETVTVGAGETVTVNFELRERAIALDEMVVTALGIERSERSLGYAMQSVTTRELERTPEVNLVQALQGQTAGVQVVQSSGRPGASSRITIRGESSFTGGGQPLFVIDGVPVSADLDPLTGRPGALGYGQAGNRAMDFDMANVEEISVLRGAAATALYGSRAAGGAVIIRTKQGRTGSPLRFDMTSTTTFDRPIIGGYITDYAAGRDGYFCNGLLEGQGGWCQPGFPGATFPGPQSIQNWGPHRDSIPQIVFDELGEVRFRDVREDYYNTARAYQNSIRATGSIGDMGAYTFGISHLHQGDITPVGKLERLNLSANVSVRLNDYLQSNTSVQKIQTDNPYPNDSWNGIHRTLILVPPNTDIKRAWNEDGSPVLWTQNTPHPAWSVLNEFEESKVDRWIVSQRFGVNILPNLTLSNTWGLDTYQDRRNRHQNERPWRTEQGFTSGSTAQDNITRTQLNNDLILSLDRLQLGESGVTLSGLVGSNVFMSERTQIHVRGSDIVIPDWYNVANFQTQNLSSQLPTMRRLVGMYGQATVDYQDWAFLTVTGRNDWSSTLPTDANNYFYPSASLGLVFTDALNWRPSWMPYGKLRTSVAKVGNDAPPYSLASRYFTARSPGHGNAIQQFSDGINQIQFPFRGQVSFMQGTQLGNPTIRPESTVETEVGLELRLLDNRARVDMSYYRKKSYDQIFEVPSSSATGYTSIVRNAGDMRNDGFEISLHTRPVQTQNLSWDLRANWTKNKNSVLELAPGVTSINLAGYSWPSIRIMEGLPYGVIWGYGFQKNCVAETTDVCYPDQPVGALLIGDEGTVSDRGGSAYGFPLRTQTQLPLANAFPNWLGNVSTEVRYRGFGASALVDIRNGSNILNFETQYQVANGRSILTQDRGSLTVVEGINVNTGQPNSTELVKDQRYYNLMYGFDRHENQIEPGGFVKLREVTLSYTLPREILGRIGLGDVSSALLYVTGRNLRTWTDFSVGDPESDLYGGASGAGQYFRQFPAPQTRGLSLGMRASF